MYTDFFEYKENFTECVVKGERMVYDACAMDLTLYDAKQAYEKAFKYIGSGRIIYVNGTKNRFKSPLHFFIRKSN